MNSNYIEFAKMLKERDNPKTMSLMIGKIISPLPDIKIQLHDKIILTKDNIFIAAHIYMHYKQDSIEKWLNEGDEVSLIPTADQQLYYLVDKVVRL